MVVKPASQTPLSALALAVLAERAGASERRVVRIDRIGGRVWRVDEALDYGMVGITRA